MSSELHLVLREARLRDGRVVDVGIAEDRVATIAASGTVTGAQTLPVNGRLVTESFVDAHLHLDKVYTLPMLGDAALAAYTGEGMAGSMTAIELARAVKQRYGRAWILPNTRRALREAVRHGTLRIQAFVDVDTVGRLEGLHAVLEARAEFADVLDLHVVAFPQDGVLRDPGAAELCEQALELGADVVGGIPWIEHTDADARDHIEWACALAARTGHRVAMLVDDAGDSSLRTTQLLAEALIRHGLQGRGVACHARAVGLYARPSQLRLMELARRAGLSFVSDPHTGPLALPVDLFDRYGLPVALGQDDIEDAYYPYGRANMLEVAFLASHLLEMRSSADQDRLVDLVTTKAARVLGVPDHALEVGSQANLGVHDCERGVDLLREHAAPRWVISKGRVVVSTESRTTWHVESIGA